MLFRILSLTISLLVVQSQAGENLLTIPANPATFDELTEFWMSKAQKEEIKNLEKSGGSNQQLIAKAKGWFEELETKRKTVVREEIKKACTRWVRNKTKQFERMDMHHCIAEARKKCLLKALKRPYSRLSEEERRIVDRTKDWCFELWTTDPHAVEYPDDPKEDSEESEEDY